MMNVIDFVGQILSNVDLATITLIAALVKNTLSVVDKGLSVAEKIKKLCKK